MGAATLSFAARETLRPMPNDCFSDQDYQEALGSERPNVLPDSLTAICNAIEAPVRTGEDL